MTSFDHVNVGDLEKAGEASLQTGPFGTQLKASEYVATGRPVINVRNIGFGDVRKDDLEFVSESKALQLRNHVLVRNDIVFGRKGAVERHAFIDTATEGWIQGSDCLRLRLAGGRVESRYLSAYFRTRAHQDWMQALCSFGATMSSLNQDIVRRITFPAPGVNTQRKIAAVLVTYDNLIENNRHRIALLERMAEQLYREWFVRFRFPGHKQAKFEKGIPFGWQVERLGVLYKTASGGTPSRSVAGNYGGPIGWLKTGELKSLYILDTEETISEQGLESSSAKVFPRQTIIMAMYCAMPDVSILAVESATNQACCALLPKQNHLLPSFTYFLAKFALAQMVNFAHGAAQQNLSQEIIKRFAVLVPEKSLIERFTSVAEPMFEQIEVLLRANDRLRRARDMLLPRLISGKLRVDDLDIEFPPSMQDAAA